MHELSIAMSILEAAEEEMTKHANSRVEAIYLRVGPLAGIVKDALESAYEMACFKTQFEGSKLVFEDVPVVVYCTKCNAERPVHSLQQFCCAECHTPASQVLKGRELEVTAMELVE